MEVIAAISGGIVLSLYNVCIALPSSALYAPLGKNVLLQQQGFQEFLISVSITDIELHDSYGRQSWALEVF